MASTDNVLSSNSSAGLNADEIAALNANYAPLKFDERIRRLYQDFPADKVLVTSSFAATSAYFLHIIASIRPDQPISFVDTGFHFPQTLAYRDELINRFNLKVQDLRGDDYQHEWSVKNKLYESDPDYCCSINKVQPLESIKLNYHVWVSSLMRWQTDHRSRLEVFEERRGIIKFNPMMDVSREERDAYIAEHNLPFHPLVSEGFSSIGCTHCTVPGEGRSGRWAGKPKTECGLHY
ncbi:MAG: phosphoadenylyl-sulfate reductase [Gammaproteobacteria bacterium]